MNKQVKNSLIIGTNVSMMLMVIGCLFFYGSGDSLAIEMKGPLLFKQKDLGQKVVAQKDLSQNNKDSSQRSVPARIQTQINKDSLQHSVLARIQTQINEEKSEENTQTPSNTTGTSLLSGVSCLAWDKRPVAIMYSGDLDARDKLKNLSKAGVVLEMPHRALYGQPRLMGVFQCVLPEEAGPMRSGRTDFLSVADSFDAIFVPWGGSSMVKTLLKKNIADHVDCNGEVPFSGAQTPACYVDDRVVITSAKPAFSNARELIKLFKHHQFRSATELQGFSFGKEALEKERPDFGQINVKFEKPYRVKYLYDKKSNSYKRYYDDEPHVDATTKEQFAPKNVVTIITKMEAWNKDVDYASQGLKDPWEKIDETQKAQEHGQYPNFQLGDPWFDTVFEGKARFFVNGKDIKGYWKREKGEGVPFRFFDKEGQQIQFVPGQTWIHVLDKGKKVSYHEEPK